MNLTSSRTSNITDTQRVRLANLTVSYARALGLSWTPSFDAFLIQPRVAESPNIITKRSVLSRVAQIFDPLGWITPITITAKILLQDLWRLKISWDDSLPNNYKQRWMNFQADLKVITVTIPCWLGISSSSAFELHGFSDASQCAIGAVVYVRVLDDLDNPRISLVAAKSKVAPLKKVTIPRLELSAAVLLVRLIAQVQIALRCGAVPVHLWVDSSVALAWINAPPSRWKEFVANRVALIHELAPAARWHHVAGSDNPADLASRGVSPKHLVDLQLWWTGPQWLSHSSVSWPSAIPPLNADLDLEERPAHVSIATTQPVQLWGLIDRYSNFSRLVRITAWLMRAISQFWRHSKLALTHALTPSEIRAADTFWIKNTQAAYFANELLSLTQTASLPRSHPFLRLAPFIDSEGVLRVGGRLRNSALDPDAKHPILIPRDATLSQLIINDTHIKTLHGGVQLTLAVLRQRFWILGGRAPIGAFIRCCVRCTRYRAVAAATELMGQLPSSRVNTARPFLHAGVDYAGPFTLKTWHGRAHRTYKGFLVMFVCFSTSAVHLEMATDYSSQEFIAAYKRFVGRRGICSSLTSDCGTNFVGADAELRRMFNSASRELGDMANVLASTGTEWRLHPPAAPHFGGKWKAAVKSVKFHLRRLVGDPTLTYEEFTTLLIEIESILNSRPLCPLSDDPADLKALTPAHFLIGQSMSTVPEPSMDREKTSHLSLLQYLRQITDRFWRRWSREYLQRLHGISKWKQISREIKIGSLVLLIDDRYPPSKWALARVIQTHPGADGLIRVVTVRTANSIFIRPIVKLCPLPIA